MKLHANCEYGGPVHLVSSCHVPASMQSLVGTSACTICHTLIILIPFVFFLEPVSWLMDAFWSSFVPYDGWCETGDVQSGQLRSPAHRATDISSRREVHEMPQLV